MSENKVDVHIVEDFNINVKYEGLPPGVVHVNDEPIDHQQAAIDEDEFNFDYSPVYMDIDDVDSLAYDRVQLKDLPHQRITNFYRYCLHKPITIGIVAGSGEGKTSLVYKMFDEYRGPKPLSFLKHPNPDELKRIITTNGRFIYNIPNFERLKTLNNIIVVIDEPQILFNGRKGFDELLMFLSVARHKDITCIFLSNETRWFQAKIEAHIQCWFVKDIDYDLVKRLSKVGKIIKRAFPDEPQNYKLNVDEFIFSSRKFDYFNSGMGEVYRFKMASWFNENLSKSYRNEPLRRKVDAPLPVILTK